ncbi:SDR family oxidoreductase [Rhizobium sp. CFBP 8762]|uniref:SDR family oxidoreductase n=1 Tax=Rhizobium sp. CFBP 8762 TaxID=2775279 RepID=UPI001781B300|nr:SDR family oxidoreductase [Rhizobium sp. CFBP 8762]MBD8553829.1 SDR family oxidoreductase [Rhizobium sp. CFBP 8762]
MQVLILGAGYSGKAIGQALAALGGTIVGTTRSEHKMEALRTIGITPLIYDGVTISDELTNAMRNTTHLVQSISPAHEGDPLFHKGAESLQTLFPHLQWIGYLSTIGVYGDHQGEWVDEDSPCRPVSSRSIERVTAENNWVNYGKASGIPVSVLRLSGIYGPGRNTFCNLAEGTARRLVKPGQVFNRIRVEDIGAATAFLATGNHAGIYNITDDEPAPPQDVVTEAARLMGVEPPPELDFETAELSPMARSFYGENKRVRNRRICELGFGFQFPNYRVSLENLWRNGAWQR